MSSTAADKYVGTFVHLKKKPKSEEALVLLKRVAAHVRPIMATRNFHVKTLAEFYPTQTNLLGTNYGKGIKISLRLRPHYNDSEFLPFEDILGTMLHELTHNTFGPHDAKFYALLDDLNIEYDKLVSKGFRGNDGDSLGGRKLSILEAKKAIELRALKQARGTGQDGRKLGGSGGSISSNGGGDGGGGGSAEEVRRRVVQAAQRRLHDAKWCGHGRAEDPILVDDEEENVNRPNEQLKNNANGSLLGESVKENEDALQDALKRCDSSGQQEQVSQVTHNQETQKRKVLEVIEIDSDDDVQSDRPQPSLARSTSQSESNTTISKKQKRSMMVNQEQSEDYKRMKARGLLSDTLYDHLKKLNLPNSTSSIISAPEVSSGFWSCTLCTLLNPVTEQSCRACHGERPSQSKIRIEQWKCEVCDLFNERVRWMCRGCLSIKNKS